MNDVFNDSKTKNIAAYDKERNSQLFITTFNVKNIRSNDIAVNQLLDVSDVICIQEHWLYNFEQDAMLQLNSNFDAYTKSVDDDNPISPFHKPRGFSGVSIMWNKKLKDSVYKIPDGGKRIVCIELQTESKKLCILNAYLPCRGRYSEQEYAEVLDEIAEIIKKFGNSHIIILAGDLNASLTRDIPNSRDVLLRNFCLEMEISTDVPNEPTFFHVNGNDRNQTDYLLVKECDKHYISSYVAIPFCELTSNVSDHIPVTVSIDLGPILKKFQRMNNHTTHMKLNWDKMNKDEYRNVAETFLTPSITISNSSDLLTHLESLMSSLNDAANSCNPVRSKTKKSRKGLIVWTPAISKAAAESKLANRNWKMAGSPKDSNHVTCIERKRAKARLRSAIRSRSRCLRDEKYNKIATAHKNDSKLFYKLIRQQRSNARNLVEEIHYNNEIFDDPDKISHAFRQYFESLATPGHNVEFDQQYKVDAILNRILIDELFSMCPENSEIQHITYEEMSDIICSLSTGKAVDLDNLSAEHLKYGGEMVVDHLVAIVNFIFDSGCVPDILKCGSITPVIKKGKDPSVPTSYRGITVTSIIMKVVEKAWMLRVSPIIKKHQNGMQKGFTEASSSINAALLVSEAINDASDMKKPIYITLLDASKAFDVVDHDILLNELYDIGVSGNLWFIFQSMYQNSTSKVKWKNSLSTSFTIAQGVKQGGVTSAPGYKVYTNSLLDQLQQMKIGFSIGTTWIPAPTCADDIAIVSSDMVESQVLLNQVESYSKSHRYTINPTKSATIVHNTTIKPNHIIAGEEIPVPIEAVHLGVRRNQRNVPNMAALMKMGRSVTYALMGAGLHGKDGLPPHIAYHLIIIYVLPRMMHGTEVMRFSNKDLAVLEKFHRKQLRQIQFLPEKPPPANTAVYALLGAKSMEAYIDMAVLTLFGNIARQPESIEFSIAVRQLAIKNDGSSSWFQFVKSVLAKYGLPSPFDVIKNPLSKTSWKTCISTAVNSYWQNQWRIDHGSKSSLRYLNINACRLGHPHHVWNTLPSDCREVEKAAVKARLLTGTYVLQVSWVKFNQHETDSTCLLCKLAPEDMKHFIIDCPALSTQRQYQKAILRRLLLTECIESEVDQLLCNGEVLLQFIMDCSHDSLQNVIVLPINAPELFEPQTRQWCFSLHMKRCNLMKHLT